MADDESAGLVRHRPRSRGRGDALLRHNREAGQAAQAFRNLPPPQRDQLVQFLKSL